MISKKINKPAYLWTFKQVIFLCSRLKYNFVLGISGPHHHVFYKGVMVLKDAL